MFQWSRPKCVSLLVLSLTLAIVLFGRQRNPSISDAFELFMIRDGDRRDGITNEHGSKATNTFSMYVQQEHKAASVDGVPQTLVAARKSMLKEEQQTELSAQWKPLSYPHGSLDAAASALERWLDGAKATLKANPESNRLTTTARHKSTRLLLDQASATPLAQDGLDERMSRRKVMLQAAVDEMDDSGDALIR